MSDSLKFHVPLVTLFDCPSLKFGHAPNPTVFSINTILLLSRITSLGCRNAQALYAVKIHSLPFFLRIKPAVLSLAPFLGQSVPNGLLPGTGFCWAGCPGRLELCSLGTLVLAKFTWSGSLVHFYTMSKSKRFFSRDYFPK